MSEKILKSVGDLIGVHDVATVFKVSHQTVKEWIKNSDFPKPFKVGNKFLWDSIETDTYLQYKRVKVGSSPKAKDNV